MNKEECIRVVAETPDYVMSIFWIFLTVLMLAIILTIIIAGLNALAECYQDRRRAYLRNKQMELELKQMERQKNE